jgi:hypothetical protein
MAEQGNVTQEKIALILCCTGRIEKGVGVPWGLPALKYGKKLYSLKELSRLMEAEPGDAVMLDKKRFPKKTLEDMGVGPLSRFTDGNPIRPLPLKPIEVLRRGSAGLSRQGFWSGMEFDKTLWIRRGDRERIFTSHLEFLRTYGINGGVEVRESAESAAFLSAYLKGLGDALAAETQNAPATVLVLTGKQYYESYLRNILSPDIPAGRGMVTGRYNQYPLRFQGIALGFYEELPKNQRAVKTACDILILIEPDGFFETYNKEPYLKTLKQIKARLKLGILKDASAFYNARYVSELKTFFGVRGELRKLASHLFRNIDAVQNLPQKYAATARIIRRPPAPFGINEQVPNLAGDYTANFDKTAIIAGGARFVIQAKFNMLRTADYKNEQNWFYHEGRAGTDGTVPLVPYNASYDRNLVFDKLKDAQLAFFLFWRSEFRKGRITETLPGYIYLYARELALFVGKEPALAHFRELIKLWLEYREVIPELDYHFPRWLIDFAVLYNITAEALPLLLPRAPLSKNDLLHDMYLHNKYVEGDSRVSFEDISMIIGGRITWREKYEAVRDREILERSITDAVTAADNFLRERYGKKLLAFFYPSIAVPQTIYGFGKLYDTGYSMYTAEWIGFCAHRPLGDFLENIAEYVLFKLAIDGFAAGKLPLKGKTPALEPFWQRIIDGAPGFPGVDPAAAKRRRTITLEAETLAQLRSESDDVRELLRLDKDEPDQGKAATVTVRVELPADTPVDPEIKSPEGFIASLTELEKEAIRIIAGADDRDTHTAASGDAEKQLDELARKHRTMPELIFDGINERFREQFNDLLIDTTEETPLIQEEYVQGVREFLRTP